MPIRPSVAENIRYLQRQINQQGTGRFGPMSIGPGEGHLRFYAADGRVLFEADSSGASVESRGSLAGLTPLLDSILDKDDDQDGTLGQHSSRLDTLHSRANAQDTLNATQNGQLAQLRVDLTNESARIDNRATVGQLDATNTRVTNVEARNTYQDGRIDTLHSRANSQDTLNATQNGQIAQLRVDVNAAGDRADSAWTRAGTGIANAATAQARANSAHTRIDGLNYASPGDIATLSNQVQALRSQVHDWMQTARASNPSLPPPIPQ